MNALSLQPLRPLGISNTNIYFELSCNHSYIIKIKVANSR